jgi:hypothetical protein
MKIFKLRSQVFIGLTITLPSFQSDNDTDLYWFQPASETYITSSVISPFAQDEVDRLNNATSSNAYTQDVVGVLFEEGFLGTRVDESTNETHPYPTKQDPYLPDERIYYLP